MEEIDLKELFDIFWKKKVFILLVTVLFAVLGFGYTKYVVVPEYESLTTLILTKSNNTENNTITGNDVTLNQQLVATYTELIKTNNIIREVLKNLEDINIEEETLRNNITVRLVTSTQLIEISVKNSDPKIAKDLTNEIAKVFIEKAKDIYKLDNLQIVDKAKEEEQPYNINYKKNIIFFGMIGFIVSAGFVFIRSLLDTTIKKSEEAEKRLGLTVLASIPQYHYELKQQGNENKKELMISQNPKSPISEIFRTLRTNLQFMTSNQGMKTLLVTSSVPGEGKSWVSANLAISFANEGKKVALIDSDMRKGRLHEIFEIERKPGLSNYLSGISEIENKEDMMAYFQTTSINGVYVMSTGDIPPNPSELLGLEKMQEFLTKLKNTFDMVIFDGTPALLVTDSIILAKMLDGSLLVTSYQSTKMGEIEKVKKMIEHVGGTITGLVINKIPVKAKNYEHSYYYGQREEKQDETNMQTQETQNNVSEEKKENKDD